VLVLLKLFTYFVQQFLPVFGKVMNTLFYAFLPFILAFLIALLMEPIVTRLMKGMKMRRPFAAILSLILVIAGIVLFVSLIVVRLYNELSALSLTFPSYNYFMILLNQLIDRVEKFIVINPQIQATMNSSVSTILTSLQNGAATASLALLNFLAAVPGFFIILVITMVATYMMSASFPGVKRFFEGFVPQRWHMGAQSVGQDLGSAIVGFVRSETILISITGVTLTFGLLLMANPYAFTIGFVSAFLDLLPIVGTGLIFVPWAIILLILGNASRAVQLLIIWAVALVIRQILEPKIMSKGIGLHPLPTLISMYVGLKLLGGVGLVLGPGLVILYEAIRKAGIFTDPKN
jgi:sporulation integral membrane protein YtvI